MCVKGGLGDVGINKQYDGDLKADNGRRCGKTEVKLKECVRKGESGSRMLKI
jgi:hypothetical protein